MSTFEETESVVAGADAAPVRRGIVFWICRYLPAEVVGTAAMVIAGLGVTVWTSAPPVVAIAAVVGESVGFYLVLAITIYLEQRRDALGPGRAAARTVLLLVAEFGAAEFLDTLVIRPAALMLGVWLIPDPVWGLLAGKLAADLAFYSIAASAFTITDKTGLRRSRRAERSAA